MKDQPTPIPCFCDKRERNQTDTHYSPDCYRKQILDAAQLETGRPGHSADTQNGGTPRKSVYMVTWSW